MKRYCLFDSKHTWDHEACISDLLPSAEALGFFFSLSLPLMGTGRCIFSNLSTKPWVMFVLGAGGNSAKSREETERKRWKRPSKFSLLIQARL